MRALPICALFLCLSSSLLACPPQYDFIQGYGCVRTLYECYLGTSPEYARKECEADNAHFPIIKTEQANDLFNSIFGVAPGCTTRSALFALDLFCNYKTRRLQWYDGAPVDYAPGLNMSLNCDYMHMTAYSFPFSNGWIYVNDGENTVTTYLCVIETPEDTTKIPAATTLKSQPSTTVTYRPIEEKCPPYYQLIKGYGCVRTLADCSLQGPSYLIPQTHQMCVLEGGHLPILKTKEDNDLFNSLFVTYPDSCQYVYALDTDCNRTTRRLQWHDGTPLDYAPGIDINSDCVSTRASAVMTRLMSNPPEERWFIAQDGALDSYTVICIIDVPEVTTKNLLSTTTLSSTTATPTEQPKEIECGEYSRMGTSSVNKPCIKVFSKPLPWEFAQRQCAADFGSLISISSEEENKYIWRTAISYSLTEGIHIGAHQPTKDSTKWTWSDGEIPFDDGIYQNFVGYFPIPGAGECAAMLTESSSAQWINEDCSENEMPFICRRVDFSALPTTCPKEAPREGEDILPPGLPDSLVPCEYVLFVAAKKQVELEILTLITEVDKDFLEIYEGPAGSNLIANLTGSILAPTKFTTAKSNVMRVNWKPNGSGTGRGFRIRYNEADV